MADDNGAGKKAGEKADGAKAEDAPEAAATEAETATETEAAKADDSDLHEVAPADPDDPTSNRSPRFSAVDPKLMERFIELNEECFDLGLDLLVFPQGTRSVRLSRGRVGLAQVALHAGRAIVPVGCSGCDRVYRGGSPWARSGHITYRIGAPLRAAELAEFALPDGVEPFGAESDDAHRGNMQALVDRVMDRINDLVDPEYRYGDDRDSDGVSGARRFV